jgi:hypothetical protein
LIEIACQPQLFAIRGWHFVRCTTEAAYDGWTINYNKRAIAASALERIDH